MTKKSARLNRTLLNITPLPWEHREWVSICCFWGMVFIGAALWVWVVT